jgi:hypothetical protein
MLDDLPYGHVKGSESHRMALGKEGGDKEGVFQTTIHMKIQATEEGSASHLNRLAGATVDVRARVRTASTTEVAS